MSHFENSTIMRLAIVCLLFSFELAAQNSIVFNAMYAFEDQSNGRFLNSARDSDQNYFFLRESLFLNTETVDIQIYKVDSEMNLIWKTDLVANGIVGSISNLSPDYQGGCYVSFSIHDNDFTDGDSDSDYNVYRINASGEILWQKVLGSDEIDSGYFTIAARSDNTLMFAGQFGEISGTFNDSAMFHQYTSPFIEPPSIMTKFIVAQLDGDNGNILSAFCPYDSIYTMAFDRSQLYVLSDNSYVLLSSINNYSSFIFDYIDANDISCNGMHSVQYKKYSANHDLLASHCISELSLNPLTNQLAISKIKRAGNHLYFNVTSPAPPKFVTIDLQSGIADVYPMLSNQPLIFSTENDINSNLLGLSSYSPNCEGFGLQVISPDILPLENYCIYDYQSWELLNFSDNEFLLKTNDDLPNDSYGGCFLKFKINSGITGQFFFDQNHNGIKDIGEFGVNLGEINFTGPNGTGIVNCTPEGNYYLSVNTGNYTLNPILPEWLSVSPSSEVVTIENEFEQITRNFACTSTTEFVDLAIEIVPEALVAGFNWNVQVIVNNQGSMDGDVQFNLILPTGIVFDTASVPSFQSGNIVTLNAGLLNPFEHRTINLSFTTLAPPSLLPGDSLLITASLTLSNDVNSSNNASAAIIPVLSSYDPNDIIHLRGNLVSLESTQGSQAFRYLIRCQNEGNHSTRFIHVRDTLPSALDFQSLKVKASSHPVQVRIDESGAVDWFFESIQLSPSSENEENSKAWILFEVNPKTNLSYGDVILNNAHIYFDFNDAIITNTDSTHIDFYNGINPTNSAAFSVIPNPANELVTLVFDQKTKHPASIDFFSVDGKCVLKQSINQGIISKAIDVSELSTGVYFLVYNDNSNSSILTMKLVILE